jgi:large subunit ribosomal protein L3
MKFILGRKMNMTQIFDEKGNVVPVTLIEAGPCFITQVKTKEKDGYEATQIGFLKKKNPKKTDKKKEYRYLREFKDVLEQGRKNKEESEKEGKEKTEKEGEREKEGKKTEEKKIKKDKEINVSIFEKGEKVKVSGVSKGKGFQGAVKKWGFSGRNATHGVKHEHRTLGSVGSTDAARVFKGKKMPGRMGFTRNTVKNLEVVGLEPEKNILIIKGALPGRKGTLLEISSI